MYIKADDEKIGKYLSKKIAESYDRDRKFCRDYLISLGESADEDSVKRMANRLSAIKKGKKCIQTYDLPIFAHLLNITCEEILSAGDVAVFNNHRKTIYDFALNQEEEVWEEYINRDDNLVLNADEYEKTIIDYALEFKNYKLIKYLIDKEYIWFTDPDPNKYINFFSAGTNIKSIYDKKNLSIILGEDEMTGFRLRREITSLAIENKDFEMLERLKIREVPTFYSVGNYYRINENIDVKKYYSEDLIETIAKADDEVLDYFTDGYELEGRFQSYICIYPFVGKLVDLLICKKHKRVNEILDKCIKYNQTTYTDLIESIKTSCQTHYDYLVSQEVRAMYSEQYLEKICDKKSVINDVLRSLKFDDEDRVVGFDAYYNDYNGIVYTSVVYVSEKSKNDETNRKIKELNDIYEKIKNLKGDIENERVLVW